MRTRQNILCGAVLLLVAAFGCGDDDERSDGGSGGSAGATGSGGSGGASTGAGGKSSGSGGTTSTGSGGSAGSVNDGGAGGEGPDEAFGVYVDALNGNDDNPGTEDEPLKTIAHALTLVEAGNVVYLLPGDFSPATEPTFGEAASSTLDVPDAVTIAALTPGTVTLVNGTSGGLVLLGSAALQSIDFVGFAPALTGSTGTLILEGLSFGGASNSCGAGGDRAFIELSGDVEATISAGTNAVALGASGECFARVEDTASLTITELDLSGAQASASGALLTAVDDATLLLDDVTIDGELEPILARDQASVAATNSTLIDASGLDYAVHLFGDTSFTLSGDSTVTGATFTCIVGDGTGGAATPTISVIDSTLSDCSTGIGHYTESTPVVELDGAMVTGMTFDGVEMVWGGSLTVTDSVFTGNGGNGIGTDGPSYTIEVTVRGSDFTDNDGAGITVRASPDSTFDLGRGNDPGENTFTGNDVTFGGVRLNLPPEADSMIVYAAGNTWIANAQDADEDGHYSVTSGDFNDVTTGTGPNYSIVNGVLRIAEDP